MNKFTRIFSLFTISLFIFSCNKDQTERKVDTYANYYKFTKKINFDDGKGHQIAVSIWGDSEGKVSELTPDDFIFEVVNRSTHQNGKNHTVINPTVSKEKKPINDGRIFINIDEHNITSSNEGVIFKLKPQVVETRDMTDYVYGADGYRGVESYMTVEIPVNSGCRFECDLEKLNTSSSWFYSGLAEWTLNSVGNYGTFCSSTERFKYRFSMDDKSCSIGSEMIWLWYSC